MRCNYISRSVGLIVYLSLMFSMFGLDIARMRIAHPSGSGEIFHGGVYVYMKYNGNNDIMMENHIRLMANQGLTHLFFAEPDDPTAAKVVQWCRTFRTHASFQHDYFMGTETAPELASKVASAAAFINSVWDYPEYLTSSVREEPPNDQAFIDGLFNYYGLINTAFATYGHGDTAPIYLLLNSPGSADKASQKSFKPMMAGYDRPYMWGWVPGVVVGGYNGYLVSPHHALWCIHGYLNEFTSYVDSSIQWPAAVLSGNAKKGSYAKSYLLATYGQNNYDHYLRLARYNNGEGNQGFKESGDNILVNDFYMPPANCMSCQAWLAVARGYRSVFIWDCTPEICTDRITLMGSTAKGTPALNEYGQTIRELQKYAWLINRMQYQPYSTKYLSTNIGYDDHTFTGSFNVPGYTGRVVVLVNADVGVWSQTSPSFFAESSVFRISDSGIVNSSDYMPKTDARTIFVTNMISGAPDMYDLETGTKIGNASGSIAVLPGKGKLIFIGNYTEMTSLRAKCGMTTVTGVSGFIPNREQIRADIQIVDPANPLINNSGYSVTNTGISKNKRYRLHVTAKSYDGAMLGALPAYYDGSWHTYTIVCVDGSVLWNKTLSSTPITFVSEDFAVNSGSQARFYLYRSNQQGTIEIDDAWLEDCDSQEILKNIQVVYPVDPIINNSGYGVTNTSIWHNKRYRLHVTAKSSDGARLGALPAYYDGSWHTYTIECVDGSVLWNKALSSTPTTFTSEDFTVNSGTQARFYLYRSNQTGTIQIDNAWLEDCDSHREIGTEWMHSSTYPVNNGENYQVYARVRSCNYPSSTTFSVKIYEYDANNNLLGYYDTTPAIADETLTEQPTVFKGSFQKHHASAHHVRLTFINLNGNGAMMLESACVGKIIQ